jgi:hypothetical protein
MDLLCCNCLVGHYTLHKLAGDEPTANDNGMGKNDLAWAAETKRRALSFRSKKKMLKQLAND